MVDVVSVPSLGFTIWQHETGLDKVNGSSITAIASSFTTNELSMLKSQSPTNQTLSVSFVEPDFNQVGDMTLTVSGRANARAQLIAAPPITFSEYSSDNPAILSAQEQVLGTQKPVATHRLMRFTFESNVAGGDYFMGETQAHLKPDGERIT